MLRLTKPSLIVFAVILGPCCLAAPAQKGIVDLTRTLSQDSIHWGYQDYQMEILARNFTSDKNYLESNAISMAEHTGTHLDAPAHMAKGSWRVDEIPADRLVGPVVVMDIKAKGAANCDYLLSVQDLQDWEEKYGRIPDGAIVMMNSGWSSKYPEKHLVFGTETYTDSTTFHFPGFASEAAEWLVNNRSIVGVGVDTPSVDYGQSKGFKSHVVFFSANVYALENVNNLDALPVKGAMIVVGITKFLEGSGGPVRLIAFTDPSRILSGNGEMVAVNFGPLATLLFYILFVH